MNAKNTCHFLEEVGQKLLNRNFNKWKPNLIMFSTTIKFVKDIKRLEVEKDKD